MAIKNYFNFSLRLPQSMMNPVQRKMKTKNLTHLNQILQNLLRVQGPLPPPRLGLGSRGLKPPPNTDIDLISTPIQGLVCEHDVFL